jgi:uncharacterized protein YcsI (UPF0317 family)
MSHKFTNTPNGKFPRTGVESRSAIRTGIWKLPTATLAPGYVQANLVILPEKYAYDFLLFCQRNPKACPLLDVLERGCYLVHQDWAENADLRIDLSRYRVYKDGILASEPEDLREFWKDDFVSFLIGCSFTFEQALIEAGIPIRHQECGSNVPMYRTNIACRSAGIFQGPMVVSMRPIPGDLVSRAVIVTSRFPAVHGAPVYIGDPTGLGITDLAHPDYGDAVPVYSGEIPVFWACGVTPQAAAQSARVPLMITHAPGYMFITDRLNLEFTEK